MGRLPIVILGLFVTILHGVRSTRQQQERKVTYVTHVGFGTRGSLGGGLGALSPCRRFTSRRGLVLNLGGTSLAAVRMGLRPIKVFGLCVANLQGGMN